MHGRLRLDLVDDDAVFVLVLDFRGDFAVDDFLEKRFHGFDENSGGSLSHYKKSRLSCAFGERRAAVRSRTYSSAAA